MLRNLALVFVLVVLLPQIHAQCNSGNPNGVLQSGEGCDDGNNNNGDGCNNNCQVENGFSCTGAVGQRSVCTRNSPGTTPGTTNPGTTNPGTTNPGTTAATTTTGTNSDDDDDNNNGDDDAFFSGDSTWIWLLGGLGLCLCLSLLLGAAAVAIFLSGGRDEGYGGGYYRGVEMETNSPVVCPAGYCQPGEAVGGLPVSYPPPSW
eukprot:NODE_1338_length_899_cov_224.247409_g1292_i0.p2 GENE.NODE_1338_length_899_cov_224.247409_g1292_i0~~NODE_1338_length_899_cov_224.247409_g1292_i0.p2  ORF type:complete len:204 (+),score=41.17 NODE_1338_length_899_cov_224.247409_g1292_i0:81-692(+)